MEQKTKLAGCSSFIASFITIVMLLAGVIDKAFPQTPPSILDIFPHSGVTDTAIRIRGTGFGDDSQVTRQVIFYDGVLATKIFSWTDTEIVCAVPDGAQSGCVKVALDSATSNCIQFFIGLPGDVNSDGLVDLEDALLSLQIVAGFDRGNISTAGDVNLDGKVGVEDAIYVLRRNSESAWTAVVTPAGGTLVDPNGTPHSVFLKIPPGAVTESTVISLNDLPVDQVKAILSGKEYPSTEKRFLGGFSAEPDGLVFNIPIKASVPILPLKPYEIPLQLEIDLVEQKYWITKTNLNYLADQQAAEIEISHLSAKAVGGFSGLEFWKFEEFCTDPFWNGIMEICKDYDPLQPAACLLHPDDRPKDLVCCKDLSFSVKSEFFDFAQNKQSGDCQALFDNLEITYHDCFKPDGSRADPAIHEISEISPNCDIEELAELFLQKYEGQNGFLGHVKGLTSCADPSMGQVINEVAEFKTIFSELNHFLGYAKRDCVYQNELKPTIYRQCSSFTDYHEASRISLKNKIEEMSMKFDQSCISGLDPLAAELKYLECIGLGAFLGQSGIIHETFYPKEKFFDNFGEILFDNKTCGIHDLYIDPDQDHLLIGDTTLLKAIAKDKAGNILQNREVIWGKDKSEAVTMAAAPQTVLITGNKDGNSLIEAFDEVSFQAIVDIELPDGTHLVTAPKITGFNTNTSLITVGGYVQLNPSQLFLIPPEQMTIEATLYDPFGRVSAPTGYYWRSSDEEVVSVEEFGAYKSQARLKTGGPGVATITATELSTGLSATAKVRVGAKMVVTPPEVCLQVFGWKQLSATVEDLEGRPIPGINPYEIIWYTHDNSIASVSIDGVVIAQSVGEVQIDATYKNFIIGSSKVSVPEFLPINFEVTPVYSPQHFVWDGDQYNSLHYLNDDREVVNVYEEAFNAAEGCEEVGEMPEKVVSNHKGLFAYHLVEFSYRIYAYIYDSNTCEEFAIPVPPDAIVSAINDMGQVVGFTYDSSGNSRGFIYNFESKNVEFLLRGAPPTDINNKGEVLLIDGAIYFNDQYINLSKSIPGVQIDIDSPFEWIRFYAINDQGVVVGNYRYWDEDWGWYRIKGFINYQDENLTWDPPFPETIPEPGSWKFVNINNHNDILIFSTGYVSEDQLEDFTLQVMHLCPLE